MKQIYRTLIFVVICGLVSLLFADPPVLANHCQEPQSCPSGENPENGKACGQNSIIVTDTSVSYPYNAKYCSRINPLFECGNGDECNEEEWWNGHMYKVFCENQATGGRTFLYYCSYNVVSRTRAGSKCPWCPNIDP